MRLYPYIMCSIIILLMTCMAMQCSPKLSQREQEKIRFDYAKIDATGLRNGEVAVDYEFCIPANEGTLGEVRGIAPDVRVLKNSKGRIECSDKEWLCIVNTHEPAWRSTLYSIASLDYVTRIEETFYE